MKGRIVAVGDAVSGDLPIVDLGGGQTPASVYAVGTETGSVKQLPAFEGERWFASADALASSDWVVLSAEECDAPAKETSEGWVCAGASRFTTLVLSVKDGKWQDVNVPNLVAPPEPVELTATGAILESASPKGVVHTTIQLGEKATVVASQEAGVPSRCRGHQLPTMTFDSASAPKTVQVPSTDGKSAAIALPQSAQLTPVLPPDLNCFSAGSFLMIPGDEEALPDEDKKIPDAEVATEGEASNIEPGEREHVVYNLAQPDAQPVAIGRQNFTEFVASQQYFGLIGYDTVAIFDAGGKPVRTYSIAAGAQAKALADGVVLVQFNRDGGLASLRVAGAK